MVPKYLDQRGRRQGGNLAPGNAPSGVAAGRGARRTEGAGSSGASGLASPGLRPEAPMPLDRTPLKPAGPSTRAAGDAVTYAELLAAYEANRRAADDNLLRKMVGVLQPHPPR